MPNRKIIAFVDNVTNDIVGPLQLHHHAAAAIRLFGEVARMENSQVGKHIQDHDVVLLGELDDAWRITPAYEIILTGEQWAQAQQAPQEK